MLKSMENMARRIVSLMRRNEEVNARGASQGTLRIELQMIKFFEFVIEERWKFDSEDHARITEVLEIFIDAHSRMNSRNVATLLALLRIVSEETDAIDAELFESMITEIKLPRDIPQKLREEELTRLERHFERTTDMVSRSAALFHSYEEVIDVRRRTEVIDRTVKVGKWKADTLNAKYVATASALSVKIAADRAAREAKLKTHRKKNDEKKRAKRLEKSILRNAKLDEAEKLADEKAWEKLNRKVDDKEDVEGPIPDPLQKAPSWYSKMGGYGADIPVKAMKGLKSFLKRR